MKKFFLLAVISAFCLALAVPAMADVKLGGMITSELNFDSKDAAYSMGGWPKGVANPNNSWNSLSFDIPMVVNFIQAAYTSDDKTVTGLIRYRFGGSQGGSGNGANAINLYYCYINYTFSEDFSMRFGRQDTLLAPFSPSQYSGYAQWLHIVGIGFGNENDTSLRDGMTAKWKINPMIGLNVGIFDPQTDNAENPTFPLNLPALPGTVVREKNDLPRFDINLPLTIANFQIIPSFAFLKQNYDQVAPGNQDGINIWGAALSARAGFGPFTITAEVTGGRNLDLLGSAWTIAPITLGAGPAGVNNRAYKDAAGNVQIEDSKNIEFFFDLAYKLGPAEVHGIYGYQNYKVDADPGIVPLKPSDITRQMYGIAVPIAVGGGFTVRPEVFIYEYGSDAEVAGRYFDLGKETIASVMFMLAF